MLSSHIIGASNYARETNLGRILFMNVTAILRNTVIS